MYFNLLPKETPAGVSHNISYNPLTSYVSILSTGVVAEGFTILNGSGHAK